MHQVHIYTWRTSKKLQEKTYRNGLKMFRKQGQSRRKKGLPNSLANRKLNKVTIKNEYLLPRVDDFFINFRAPTYFLKTWIKSTHRFLKKIQRWAYKSNSELMTRVSKMFFVFVLDTQIIHSTKGLYIFPFGSKLPSIFKKLVSILIHCLLESLDL